MHDAEINHINHMRVDKEEFMDIIHDLVDFSSHAQEFVDSYQDVFLSNCDDFNTYRIIICPYLLTVIEKLWEDDDSDDVKLFKRSMFFPDAPFYDNLSISEYNRGILGTVNYKFNPEPQDIQDLDRLGALISL